MTTKHEICCLGDMPDNEAKGFTIETEAKQLAILIFRKDDRFYGYVNRCPHTGVNLEWYPISFLTEMENIYNAPPMALNSGLRMATA